MLKTCSKCKKDKTSDLFYKNKAYKCGLTAKCKECVNEENRLWNLLNPDKKSTYQAKSDKKRYQANIEESRSNARNKRKLERSLNPKMHRDKNSQWRKNNSDKINARNAKRRAIKLRATPTWAENEKLDIQKLYTQAKQLSKVTGLKYHVDHIVPLNSSIVQGLHCLANLQILEAKENITKNNLIWPDMP